MASKKQAEWCGCEAPDVMLNGDGRPLVPEPKCLRCGFLVKRRPPGPVQPQFPPHAWEGPGLCPRPPEMLALEARERARVDALPKPPPRDPNRFARVAR